ncbi:hypothetical protein CDL12_17054 [Handroanthus impetiginosus]|uniref:NPH3 domain-containing protein n=1 Tax=Handroanthus impetiginosus TaxID=429701 RepID=A0A2G9GYL8_9LAMI|nr:hypothetical protein CDL12_17054 [Handroanthus impetiginosus]
MASRKGLESRAWRPRCKLTSEIHLSGSLFTLDKELMATKSSKIANILKKNPQEDISHLFREVPCDQETLELVSRFCNGFEINLSIENVVRVACVAHHLGMTDGHSSNNLLSKALLFFEQQVMPSWNATIKALKSAGNVLQQALKLGLVDYCVESIITKVLDDPRLLGEPMKSDDDSDENEIVFRPNARRKLFEVDWKSDDLTTLSLRIYEYIIHAMNQRDVPKEYVVANICQYAKTWLFSNEKVGDGTPIYKWNSMREIVEALERLLPHQRGIVPCKFLFEMLQFAVVLDANAECKKGLELRIGKQLDQATVKDLLIPSQGHAKDEKYDTECVRRILKHFYSNYNASEPCGLDAVSALIDGFLEEVSADIDLKTSTFKTLAEMSVAASSGTQRMSDGVYRAIDIYLDKHKYLTEPERHELCKVLDCDKLSVEALQHASRNERLPMRFVLQVLFATQLRLSDAVPKEVQNCVGTLLKLKDEKEDKDEDENEDIDENDDEDEDEEEDKEAEKISSSKDELRAVIEKIGNKVLEIERECQEIKREFGKGGCSTKVKKEKSSMWKDMKRKFGCVTTTNMIECDCHLKKKKVHPS